MKVSAVGGAHLDKNKPKFRLSDPSIARRQMIIYPILRHASKYCRAK